MTSTDDLRNLCKGCNAVFHLAACISIRETDQRCIAVNAGSCESLLTAARSEGVRRIIHFSSIHAFSHEPLDEPLDETRALELSSRVSYNRSKALGQKIIIEGSSPETEVIVLNPTAILGPNHFQPSLLGNAVIRFFRGQNPSLIPGGYDWVDVRDICSAAINAIDQGVPGECYLLSGRWKSLKEMADTVEKMGGHRAPRLPCRGGWHMSGPFSEHPCNGHTSYTSLYCNVTRYSEREPQEHIFGKGRQGSRIQLPAL